MFILNIGKESSALLPRLKLAFTSANGFVDNSTIRDVHQEFSNLRIDWDFCPFYEEEAGWEDRWKVVEI